MVIHLWEVFTIPTDLYSVQTELVTINVKIYDILFFIESIKNSFDYFGIQTFSNSATIVAVNMFFYNLINKEIFTSVNRLAIS